MVRRTGFSLISFLSILAIFLTGCFVGAAVQAFGGNAHLVADVSEAPSSLLVRNESQPLNNKPVRTIPIRSDGSIVAGAGETPASGAVAN